MAIKKTSGTELAELTKYLRSESSEKSRQHLLYPIFRKLFKDKLKIENDACGADVYVEGKLIVEGKSSDSQWVEGFYQALHYHKKFGLTYNTIIVIAHKFVAVWKLNKLPEFATILAHTASVNDAPNKVGKENAKKTQKIHEREIKEAALYWLEPKMLEGDIFANAKNLTTESFEILKILNNLDSDRLQINRHNFIQTIERMKPFFEQPIDAVHAFYTIVAFWDITSSAAANDAGDELRVVGFKGNRFSDTVKIAPRYLNDFKKFIESQYIFTNEGSGLTVDYYFSRFDEVIAAIDPEYVKQHGIFFTNDYLSKFALWFAQHHFPGNINENYIVFDPAGGSGNLVSSWRGKLKHKIVSELQPDLLRTIERRMKADPFHIETGFTIIPKTSENKGLNFLDRPAQIYLDQLSRELQHKNVLLDKPLAFLLNPPYKNTDENVSAREKAEAEYAIDASILELTGEDAGKERYLAFLGQILNISKVQAAQNKKLKPIVMIFTPTSWLLPRPTYANFRNEWDKYFQFHSGFIVTSNEWFKLDGKWPLAFTIWQYNEDHDNSNSVKVVDFTHLKQDDLAAVNWLADDETVEKELQKITKKSRPVKMDNSRGQIRDTLPLINRGKTQIQQPRYDYSHSKKEDDYNKVVSGFPLKFEEGHFVLKRKCGTSSGSFLGFMDDNTPVRLDQDSCMRMSSEPNRVWFRLDTDFKGVNKSKTFSGPADNRSYCAYDLPSAKATFTWFSITKALNAQYPVWANQYDIWAPRIPKKLEASWYSLCFAFVLAENRCVVTKFEMDNPVEGAPEVFVDNPLCPNNKESFWYENLHKFVMEGGNTSAINLVTKISELYTLWNKKYCKGQFLQNVGLHNEPYFKYFDYPDFLTPHSGLIQIKKYAEQEGLDDIQKIFAEISTLTKQVKSELYTMLVDDLKYFE